MKTTVEELEKNKILLKVEVPANDLDSAIVRAYESVSRKANIPGFRKGKIPRKVIDSKVGKESVLEEALRDVIPIWYLQAVEKSGIEPIDKPDIEVTKFEEGQPLLFNATVEVKPQVKLGEYKEVEVGRLPTEVTEEEVDLQVAILRDRFAQLEPITRNVRKGDFVLIDFDGFVDGKPFEGGSATDYLLEVGSNAFIPGFEEQMVGVRKGEIKNVWVDVPKDYDFPDIAGKKVKFKVLIKEVKQKVLPALNDDFAKEIGEFDTFEELRESFRERLKELKKAQAEEKIRQDLLEQVSAESEVEIPEVMVNRGTEEIIREFTFSLQGRGLTLDSYLEATKSTLEDMKQDLKGDAEKRVKNELVLGEIAQREGLKVSDEETDKEIKAIAGRINRNPEELERSLEERGSMGLLKEDILRRKSLDWVVEHAKIIDEKGKEDEKEKKDKKREKK
ncbi:MAG: trigger factor [Actinomycetota bacterium]|nr:trigger factor [Actinomycetota bacterium]